MVQSVCIRASALQLPPIYSHSSRNAAMADSFAIDARNLSYSVLSRLKENSDALGPNGCGKSTLKILAGLLVCGWLGLYVERPRSFVYQNPDHQVVMPTVEADVAFGLGKLNLTPNEIRTRVARALDAVGMYEYLIHTLSGGQKQRVATAGALAEACKVLLLDELTTFLDETDQIGVIKAMRNSVDTSKGITALWVTHRLEELEFADGAVYMEDGRIVRQGDATSIRKFIEDKLTSYVNQINL
ncbi:hypothetical protein HAX54_035041 [Datura stramonium]|uniref:ABC transporter domain-containing protein n=1 Tax=Datura stramonium TaxID=4076 RepID=A0ABS8SET6_DATST|nr:hypothetical protein [Datura stramonium]